MAFATKSANTWSVDDVCEYLQQLELGHLQPKFRENAVSGSDLTSLSEDDFHTELGVTKLQYRKIKTGLDSLAGYGSIHLRHYLDHAPDTTERPEADQCHLLQHHQSRSQPTVSQSAIPPVVLPQPPHPQQATLAHPQATPRPTPTRLLAHPWLVHPSTQRLVEAQPLPIKRPRARRPSCCSSRSSCCSSRSSRSKARKRRPAA